MASPNKPLKGALVGAITLALVAGVGVGLVTGVRWLTAERIAQNDETAVMARINEMLPADAYDNDLYQDRVQMPPATIIGQDHPFTVYRAFRDDGPPVAILPVTANDGYHGKIHLLVAIRGDGHIQGVRVTYHRETPGLGDRIEIAKSNWILGFNGRSLQDPKFERWRVKKDDGEFDQLTGATITPRAVIRAVRDALVYFERQRNTLLAQAPPDAGEERNE